MALPRALRPEQRQHRWWMWLGMGLATVGVLFVLFLAALPMLLSSGPGNRWLLAKANKLLTPARLEVESFRFSWFGPTRMKDFKLYGKDNKPEVQSATAVWDRTLGQVLFGRPRLGTLTLERSHLNFTSLPPEQGSHSSVRLDIIDTLRPVIEMAKPATDLTIVAQKATFTMTGHRLAQPIEADCFDLTIHRQPLPKPLEFDIRLVKSAEDGDQTAALKGDYELEGKAPNLNLAVKGEQWPLELAFATNQVGLRLDGKLEAHRTKGRWESKGDAKLLHLVATRRDGGAPMKLDEIGAIWDLRQHNGSWAIRKLELSSPAGKLTAGEGKAEAGSLETHLDGDFDLAPVLALTPGGMPALGGYHLDRGRMVLNADLVSKRADGEPSTSESSLGGMMPEYLHLKGRVDLKDVALSNGPKKLEVATTELTLDRLDARSAGQDLVLSLVGKGALREIKAIDPARSEGPLEIKDIDTAWDLQREGGAWAIRKLELTGQAGTLKAEGKASGSSMKTKLVGDLDLPALLALMPGGAPAIGGYHVAQGRLDLTANLETGQGGEPSVSSTAKGNLLDDLARGGLRLDGHMGLEGVTLSDGPKKLELGKTVLALASLEGSANASGASWSSLGKLTVESLVASEPGTAKQPIKQEGIEASWDLARAGDTWSIRSLELTGSAGKLKAGGSASGSGMKTKLDGRLDLAALATFLPTEALKFGSYHVDKGNVTLTGNLETGWKKQEGGTSASPPGTSSSSLFDHLTREGLRLDGHVGLEGVALSNGPRRIDLGKADLDVKSLEGSQGDKGLEWTSEGIGSFEKLVATDPARPKGPIHLDKTDLTWNLARTGGTWAIRKVVLKGTMGALTASKGSATESGVKTRIDADLDLATLLAFLPDGSPTIGGYHLDRGRLTVGADVETSEPSARKVATIRQVSMRSAAGPAWPHIHVNGNVALKALVLTDGKKSFDLGVIDLKNLNATYDSTQDRFDLAEVVMATNYGNLHLSGNLTDPSGQKLLDAKARLDMKWAEVTRTLAQRVEPRASIKGNGPVTLTLAGPLGGDADQRTQKLTGKLDVPIAGLNVFGMQLGKVTVSAERRDGKFTVLPIKTTLNSGTISLFPRLEYSEKNGLTLLLDKRSSLTNAVINDEVSNRVLVFVVPTLAGATVVNGTVSASVDRFEMPLSGPANRSTVVEGKVVFKNVVFRPGPVANELLDRLAFNRVSELRLDQPVNLSIHDRRVYQKGFSMPIPQIGSGRLVQGAHITADGSVGFDKTIDMWVRGSGNLNLGPLGQRNLSVPVHVAGTTDRPQVDRAQARQAVGEGIKEAIPEASPIIDAIRRRREQRQRAGGSGIR